MKIIDKRNKTTTTFGALKLLDVFLDTEGVICIKIDIKSSEDNAIELTDSERTSFEDYEIVTKLNTTLTIE